MTNTKTPVSRVGNKTAILHILYALFPLQYGRFIDVFGGSGSVLLGKPQIDAFEVYNDFDRNLANLFRCMKTRTMATIRELGFCTLNGCFLKDGEKAYYNRDDILGVLKEEFLPEWAAEKLDELENPAEESAGMTMGGM